MPARKTSSKAERTKEYIVEKTAPVFNRKGYAGTSISDLTEATGLTKGSIYGNFENKDEVALAAFDHNYQKIQKLFKEEMAKHETYREKLLVYPKVYASFTKFPFPPGGCPLLNTAIEADDTHPLLRQKAANAMNSWRKCVSGLVEDGIRAGEFRRDADPEAFAVTLLALIEGGIAITKLCGKNYLNIVTRSIEELVEGLS